MKRKKSFLLYILIAILVFSFTGCKKSEQKLTAENEIEKGFDIKAAENVITSYMQYLMQEDYENANKLYSTKLSKNSPKIQEQPLKIKGFNISEINEVGRSGLFKIKVTRVNMNQSFTSLDEYSIKVEKEGVDYKLSDVNNVVDREAFPKKNQIRMKSKNNADTNLVIDTNGIPSYIFSKDDKTNTNKLPVPKKEFGAMIFSYSGYNLAISTYNQDAFAGIVKIDESMAVQGEDQNEQQQPSDGGGSQDQGEMNIKEKPVGKEIVSLDLIKNSKIEYMTFSQDEKFILVQYKKNNKSRCIRVYNTEGGNIIPYVFEQNYPIDKVDIVFSSFDKEILNFEVLPKEASDKSIGKYIGRWQIDLKEFKVKKV